jgi:branched-chain amino acid transport system permease protein
MLGGYVTVTLMNRFGWPFLATLPAAFLAAAAVSVVLERTLYRRLYRAGELDQVLFTIGLAFISVAIAAYIFGTIQQSVNTPSYLRGSIQVMGVTVAIYRLFLVVTGAAIALLLVLTLEYTRFGAQVRAAVDNQRMARGLGIDVDRAFMITFALGGGLAGLGGALAIEVVGLDPTFALAYLVYVLIVVAVGGLGGCGAGTTGRGVRACCGALDARPSTSWRAVAGPTPGSAARARTIPARPSDTSLRKEVGRSPANQVSAASTPRLSTAHDGYMPTTIGCARSLERRRHTSSISAKKRSTYSPSRSFCAG